MWSITYPLLYVRGWLSNICTACGKWCSEDSDWSWSSLRLRKNRHIYGLAWERINSGPHFFFPYSCYGWDWRYFRLTWRYTFWCPSCPLWALSYQFLWNVKRMWLLWKDEDNEWQQAAEMAWLLPGSVSLMGAMVAELEDSIVQSSNKQTAYSGLQTDFWTFESLFVGMRFLQRHLDRRMSAVDKAWTVEM